MSEAIHHWFELSYASYLVVPRSVLQSMPEPVQAQLVAALNAVEAEISPAIVPAIGHYMVQLRDRHGRFMHDPLGDYERGRRHVTREELLAIMPPVLVADERGE